MLHRNGILVVLLAAGCTQANPDFQTARGEGPGPTATDSGSDGGASGGDGSGDGTAATDGGASGEGARDGAPSDGPDGAVSSEPDGGPCDPQSDPDCPRRGELGDLCQTDDACASGICVAIPDFFGSTCAECDPDEAGSCGADRVCRFVRAAHAFLCAHPAELGTPCRVGSDCASGECGVNPFGGHVCSTCDSSSDCPDGERCGFSALDGFRSCG